MVEVMAKRKSYVARYEKDENNYWSVTVKIDPKQAAVSDGQTLPKARRRIRQAVALLLNVSEDSFDLVDDFAFPASIRRALRSYEEAQEVAKAKAERLESTRRKAAESLVAHGISRRDAGEILGVSGQRIQQVLD
jgi:predicted RNase H-like HicB family nuclease